MPHRVVVLLALSLLAVVGPASPAMAQDDALPVGPDRGGAAATDLAAGGSDLVFWLGVVAVLVVLGTTLVVVARRHRADVEA